jgi:hypothetical protein
MLLKGYLFSLIFIFTLGVFLRLYKLSPLLPSASDEGRDLQIAESIIKEGKFPSFGPPSSLGWMRLGPFSYYLWAAILYIGNFHPLAIPIFIVFLDSAATVLLFYLALLLFDAKTAVLASLLFATSAYAVFHSRTPIHASLVPFFVSLFYVFFWKFMEKKADKYFYLSCFLLGILLQLHLSTVILVFILFLFSFRTSIKTAFSEGPAARQPQKHPQGNPVFGAPRLASPIHFSVLESFDIGFKRLNFAKIAKGVILLILPFTPFILGDLRNYLFMTGRFLIWIPYRMLSLIGITTSKNIVTAEKLVGMGNLFLKTLREIVFVPNGEIALIIFAVSIIFLIIRKRSDKSVRFLLGILGIAFAGIFLHLQPADHYFNFLMPLVILTIAYFLSLRKIGIVITVLLAVFNSYFIFLTIFR